MKKILSLVISFIILTGFLTACGGSKVKQGTMEECTKTFVKALINADEKTLNAINKSNSLSFPTHYLISDFAPDFKNYKISDFSFSTDEKNEYVTVRSSDRKQNYKLEIKKSNNKFYFFDLEELSKTNVNNNSSTTQKSNGTVNTVSSSTVINFPDKNLEQAIRTQIDKPTGDILKSDVDKIEQLFAYKKNITNLSGIEHLTNMTGLILYHNKISNIEPLKELTNLTSLDLYDNQISNIEPLKNLTNLTSLILQTNQISNIEPLKGLTNLTSLDLQTNQISDIDKQTLKSTLPKCQIK